jgi:flagellar M-ring protein FliF
MSSEASVPMRSGPQLAGLKPLLLLVGVAAAVAAGVGIALWSQAPSYSLLFGNLNDADAAQLTQSLDQAGIPYRVENGAVLVPSERVTEARMGLAAKGLPASEGFSLMEKDPGFGVSQFMENARYQHALETELSRTIASLKPVQGARVHLAVPQQSAFVRDRRPASASVFLQLHSGARLDRGQVEAIVNLVASSIPELTAEQVTVVDNQGRLLSSPQQDTEFAAREKQLELARHLEEDYSQRIVSLLTPLLGPGRVRAQVVAQIEMATTEEAREQYRPDSQIVRSEQTSEDVSGGAAGPQGVPGALTNQPPQGGVALPPGEEPAASVQATAAGTAPENASRQATRNYEIDRTVAYTRQPAGRLQRLSAAVVIDNLRTTADDGKVTESPLSEEQLARINTLVRDAVGFDEARGDRVSVVNQSFLQETTEVPEIEAAPIWENPLVRDLARLFAGLVVVVLLLLFIVRPLLRSLGGSMKAALAAQPVQLAAGAAGAAGPVSRPAGTIAYEQQIATARGIVAKDPARVAQVVKDWVENDE